MADSKVSALTELAVEPAATDEFYINDGGVSKKILWSTVETGAWASPTLVTPDLGTPSAGVMTNVTGAPALAITNMTGTGTNLTFVNPALGTPASGVITNLSGTGTNLTFVNPALGTPASGVLTNCTGSPTFTTVTLGTLSTAAESAEHGAGAIGTAATPVTYRWIESGVIITQFKIDLTGLASVATANDVIGLAAGGAAYIGRNVVATNGVIFKAEFSCIETPTTGDNDIDVVTNASAALIYDDAGGTAYLANAGDLLAGQTIQNLVPALTANDYFYLSTGTGDTAGTYASGMYTLTLYGHALLV